MNSTPAPDEIAGIPRAKATRIVMTPTTQQSAEAIRMPAGISDDGVVVGGCIGGVVMARSSVAV
jgi:hypothetical protein